MILHKMDREIQSKREERLDPETQKKLSEVKLTAREFFELCMVQYKVLLPWVLVFNTALFLFLLFMTKVWFKV